MVKVLNDYERGWAEAFIDTECALSLTKWTTATGRIRWIPSLRCRTTTREQVEKMKSIIGAGTIFGPYKNGIRKDGENRKLAYELKVTSEGLRNVLPQIRLTTKEENRVLVLEALSILRTHTSHSTPGKDRLLAICVRMRQLNQRGKRN